MNKLFILLMTVTLSLSRPQAEHNVKRQSFGLENFLFQGYEEETVRNVKPRRVRPTNRIPVDRIQNYPFENVQYESNRLRPPTKINTEPQNQKPEVAPEPSRLRPLTKITSDSQMPLRFPTNFKLEDEDQKQNMPTEPNRWRPASKFNEKQQSIRQETAAESSQFRPIVKLHQPGIESNRLRPPTKFNPEVLDQRDRLPPETNQWRPSTKYNQELPNQRQEASVTERMRLPIKIKTEELLHEVKRWEPKSKTYSGKPNQKEEAPPEPYGIQPAAKRKPEIQNVKDETIIESNRLKPSVKQKLETQISEIATNYNTDQLNSKEKSESNRLKPATKKISEKQRLNQRPGANINSELQGLKEEPIVVSNQSKSLENLNPQYSDESKEPKVEGKKVLTPETTTWRQQEVRKFNKQELFSEISENATERIRKRIMMRRRRKRPQSNLQNNSDIAANDITLPTIRIPISPQASKVQKIKTITPPEPLETTQTTTEIQSLVKETTTLQPSTINLKTFLKQQTETLSLSELLQKQNLSLADLLRGNKDASAILRAKQATPTPSLKQKFITEAGVEEISEESEVEATTARINKFYPKIPRIKIETSTAETKAEESEKQKRLPIKVDPQVRLNELRTKLRTFQRKTTPQEEIVVSEKQPVLEATTEPAYKKNRIAFKSANNPELAVILPKTKSEHESRLDRPTNWNNRLPPVKRPGEASSTTAKILKVPFEEEEKEDKKDTEEAPKQQTSTTEVAQISDIKKPEAKDELIELLKSGQNADRLQKILSSRNMTIQELLDNREKPPHTDISALFANTQRPEGSTGPTIFDSFPDFGENQRPSDSTYDEPYAEESARVELIAKEPKFDAPIHGNNENSDLKLQLDTSALWKLSEKSIYYGSSYGYGAVETEKPKTETKQENHRKEKKFKLDYSDIVTEGEPTGEEIEISYIPPAVKSAIIASGVVMGIALFVFIAIFAACGWKQRQIRLKGTSSILSDTLTKATEKTKRTNTLSPVSFKDTSSYKKTLDFDDDSSESGTSNTSSYLWSTIKHTFTNRTNTLKSRLEKEEKLREDKTTLRRNDSRRAEHQEDRIVKRIDRDRNVINTSFNFKRTSSVNSVNHFNDCVHGY